MEDVDAKAAGWHLLNFFKQLKEQNQNLQAYFDRVCVAYFTTSADTKLEELTESKNNYVQKYQCKYDLSTDFQKRKIEIII